LLPEFTGFGVQVTLPPALGLAVATMDSEDEVVTYAPLIMVMPAFPEPELYDQVPEFESRTV
jgi:hypothetical protein